ncbi:conserved hypothetical protein [Vibrio crassostreae]|uniref:hypothetical protein n=1 Tax=Vibrio crassostreae TaxID=246167 RepID=UPI001B3045B6|nr:hypothetical protein [Vibrio crassostreae]CAK1907760.1 conserved hypothetical protein [Vibrio crassostreae]CAK1914642.1 conserved hypothetical protein [Vibrio crassostreae]CAK1916256.1 conserved hypothetical protein [Vibrio crassostreae]CAK1916431.1 conserved hypothetical protein [Vibrio crassostreae]CAK1919606.1 conserved hypothetical protein [Vibrio crassostreae]
MAKNPDLDLHALSPYLLRCYNGSLEGKREERYSALDKIGQYDLLYLLKDFIEANSEEYKVLETGKQVYQFSDLKFDKDKRELYCWFNVGYYGMKSDIINIETGGVDFKKAQKNAEIIKHYVHIYIPHNVNEGMAFLHSFRGNGVKTLFYVLFSNYFRNVTNLNIQMNPLAYDKAINAWMDAPAKEVKITRFEGVADISDALGKLGHNEKELVIKPPRNGILGTLRDYKTRGSDRYKAVEVLSEHGNQIKTVVEMNGKKRTFNVGHSSTNTICEIELSEDIVFDEGVPNIDSMNRWTKEIANEYADTMYP